MVRSLASNRSSPDCFFSSRRRHTRFDCDWSSDVCSSDLARAMPSSFAGLPAPTKKKPLKWTLAASWPARARTPSCRRTTSCSSPTAPSRKACGARPRRPSRSPLASSSGAARLMVRSSWVPPPHHPGELDRVLLALCSPEATLPPRWINPETLLARAAELDVFPLTFHRLRRSPHWLAGKVSPEWEERFRSNAARNLLLDTEQERLLNLLKSAGVPALPLKGTRLATQLYADLALRAQVDVDIYVSPERLPAALGALEADGYRRVTAVGLPAERLAATGDEFTSECSLEKRAGPMPLLVELHWRLLPLPAQEMQAACADGALSGPLDFLYLCLQAAADRWGTLKTLVDLAHWVRRQPPDWEKLAAAGERLGLARILGLTLHVLLDYFELAIPEAMLARLDSAASPPG